MVSKTFKIGESCEGGRLKVEINKGYVKISCLDWNTKKEVRVCHFSEDDKRSMEENLWDMTTSYYTDKVMGWIKEQTPKPEWV